jgi:hypothetical protein
MTHETKHGERPAAHGSYEHQDLQPKSILYFLLVLAVATIISLFLLRGLYSFLDQREKSGQPKMSPLVTNVPEDTRHIAPGYPQTTFPDPRLEEDERGQLNGIITAEENRLYSYGWADENAGTVHIPIERAMDLIVERGLPVRTQNATEDAASSSESSKRESKTPGAGKGKKK